MQLSRYNVGYFAPASFDIPQNPFYGHQPAGMAGMGCSCDGSQRLTSIPPMAPFAPFGTNFGFAYPRAYAPGGMMGMGTLDLSSTGVSFLDSLGTTTIAGYTVANAYLAGAVALVLLGGMGYHKHRRSGKQRRYAMKKRYTYRRKYATKKRKKAKSRARR